MERLELSRLTALPPQDSVSTNSTTSALNQILAAYGWPAAGGAAGAAPGAAAGAVSGALVAGAVACVAGALAAGTTGSCVTGGSEVVGAGAGSC